MALQELTLRERTIQAGRELGLVAETLRGLIHSADGAIFGQRPTAADNMKPEPFADSVEGDITRIQSTIRELQMLADEAAQFSGRVSSGQPPQATSGYNTARSA